MRWILALLLLGSASAMAQPVPASPSSGDTDVPTDAEFVWRTDGSDLFEVEILNGITGDVDQTLFSETDRAQAYQLAYETRYQWRVRGVDSLGATGPWSSTRVFTTIAQGSTPTLISPENTAVDVEPSTTLVWKGASSAALFDVETDTSPDLSTATSVQVAATALPYQAGEGTTVYWRVREATIGAAPGPWSTTFSFSTRLPVAEPPSPPRLIAPANGSVDQPLEVTLDWMDVPEAETYAVRVAPTSAPDSVQLETTTSASDLTIALPPSSDAWQWMVSVTTPSGTSEWSMPWTFTTIQEADSSLEAPRALLPVPDATVEAGTPADSAAVQFSWWHDRADVHYVLQYALDADLNDTAAISMVVTQSNVTVAGFPIGSVVRWRVLAAASWAESPWCAERAFTVVAPPTTEPRPMQLQSPADQAVNVPVSAAFAWTPQTDASAYEIQIASDEQFMELVGGFVVNTTQAIGDTLEEGRRYWWRGRAENSTGPGAWTAPFSFVTTGEATSVDERGSSPGLHVQPNPASTTATVSLPEPTAHATVLRVVSADGRTVDLHPLDAGSTVATLNVAGIASGRYSIVLPLADRVIVSSITIQR